MIWTRFGEMGRSPGRLVMDWLSGREAKCRLAPKGSQTVFTQSGRAAIALAVRLWRLGNGDEALVPAYHCGSEISPLVAAGMNVRMYPVSDRAQVDVGDIIDRITPRVRLVLIIHYFGRATDIRELVKVCRERKIKVLEDCALSLFSDSVGEDGDGVVFSFRKSLPAIDGGALVLRQPIDSADDLVNKARVAAQTRGLLSVSKKWLENWLPARPTSAGDYEKFAIENDFPEQDIPPSYYWTDSDPVYEMSRFTLGMLNRIDSIDLVRLRRDNYAHLRRYLAGLKGVRFLWDEDEFPIGKCPLGLPVLVNDKARWHSALNASGVQVSPWWMGYHRGFDWSEFPEVRRLKGHLLLLPIHQELTTQHMERMGDIVRSIHGALQT